MKDKLTSRKFWLSVAAFLGSLGVSVAGITTKNEVITVTGLICSALSAAIYAGCEAVIDKAAISTEIEEESEE